MATQIITVRGRCYWARVFEQNRDLEGWEGTAKEFGGMYTINVELDDDGVKTLMGANSQSVDYPKTLTDENGKDITVYRFKRKHEAKARDGRILEWASGAPKVTNLVGDSWDLDHDGLIGNGSEVEVTLAVYQAGRNYGTRLEKVKVIDHVEAPEKVAA